MEMYFQQQGNIETNYTVVIGNALLKVLNEKKEHTKRHVTVKK